MAGIKRLLPFPSPRSLSLSSCHPRTDARPLTLFRFIRLDVLAGVALTWISYPVAFDNGAGGSFFRVKRRNRGRLPALKNEVTCVSCSR